MEAYNERSVDSVSASANCALDQGYKTLLSELLKCTIQWKSTATLSLRHPLGNAALEMSIRSSIALISTKDLLRILSQVQPVRHREGENPYESDYRTLQIASVSIQSFLESEKNYEEVDENVVQEWMENSDMLTIINRLFDDPRDDIAEQKKVALDLGYVIASRMLQFGVPSFGLCAPITKAQQLLLLITTKLLESFMVTTPPHFPFMPAQHFATIRWPVEVRESCSGKVHGIVTFLPMAPFGVKKRASAAPSVHSPSSDASDSGDGSSEASAEKKEDAKYCNFEVVARRQPWKEQISALQLYQLAQVLIDSRTPTRSSAAAADSMCRRATAAECEEVLCVLRNVFQRIAKVDSALLCRDPAKLSPVLDEQCCCPAVTPTLPVSAPDNPFASFARKMLGVAAPRVSGGTGLSKARCRLCAEVTCSACAAPQLWVNDRVCTTCYAVIPELRLQNIQEKKPRNRLFTPRAEASTVTAGSAETGAYSERKVEFAVPTFAAIARVGGTRGAHSEEEADDTQEQYDGQDSPCCSETMTDSLRSWRDGVDTDEEDGLALPRACWEA